VKRGRLLCATTYGARRRRREGKVVPPPLNEAGWRKYVIFLIQNGRILSFGGEGEEGEKGGRFFNALETRGFRDIRT